MKMRIFMCAWVITWGGIFLSYAALPVMTIEEKNPSTESAQEQTNTIGDKPQATNPSFGVQPQTDADLEKRVQEMLKNKPDWVTQERIDKYGVPLDKWDGYESDARAYMRYIGVSANGIRAEDNMVKLLRMSADWWDNNGDGMCANGVITSSYNLFGLDPTLYFGKAGETFQGENDPRAWLEPFVRSGAYRWLQPGESPAQIGVIALGGGHTAMFWQTAEDALGKTSTPNGDWVAQWAGQENYSQYIGPGYNGAVLPIARPDQGQIINADGSRGQMGQQYLSWRWKKVKEETYPEPSFWGTSKSPPEARRP